MSLSRALLALAAQPLKLWRRHRPRHDSSEPRILVIRRNRLGDMIYTLPLLHALRRHYPKAHLTVACDPLGAPIAAACAAVDDVIVLDAGGNRWLAAWKNAGRLQGYDWVIAAKGGFDQRMAVLTRLTNGARRIGFERRTQHPSACYTDPVALPDDLGREHQIDTLLRLLHPLGLVEPSDLAIDLSLRLPQSAREFAKAVLARPPFFPTHRYMLINLSSTVPLKFREEDFLPLMARVLDSTDLAIGLVAALADQPKARDLAARAASERVAAVATPGPLDLAALLERTVCLLTPEGGAAHLAAVVDAPALVLWSEGPFYKWYSRGSRHAYLYTMPGKPPPSLEQVWEALQPFLVPKP